MIENDKCEAIHIAFCTSNYYIPHTVAAIASILVNTKSRITFHLIHDSSLTIENQEMLNCFVQRYHQDLFYHLVDERDFDYVMQIFYKKGLRSPKKESLYRLRIVEALKDIPKVIFLGSDIIANMDLSLLWKMDLGQALLGAVLDDKRTRMKWLNRYHFWRMGINYKYYFNADVMLLNLKKIRAGEALWEKSLDFFSKYAEFACFGDQDVLNYLFKQKVKILPHKFNFISVGVTKTNLADKVTDTIIHYAGPKPWDYRSSDYDWLYWKYFSMTPGGDTVRKLLDAQQKVGIDLGYALQVGKIASRKNLLKGVYSFFRR